MASRQHWDQCRTRRLPSNVVHRLQWGQTWLCPCSDTLWHNAAETHIQHFNRWDLHGHQIRWQTLQPCLPLTQDQSRQTYIQRHVVCQWCNTTYPHPAWTPDTDASVLSDLQRLPADHQPNKYQHPETRYHHPQWWLQAQHHPSVHINQFHHNCQALRPVWFKH